MIVYILKRCSIKIGQYVLRQVVFHGHIPRSRMEFRSICQRMCRTYVVPVHKMPNKLLLPMTKRQLKSLRDNDEGRY